MSENAGKILKAAIKATKDTIPGYFEATVEKRSPKTGCGSVFTFVECGVEHALFDDHA